MMAYAVSLKMYMNFKIHVIQNQGGKQSEHHYMDM